MRRPGIRFDVFDLPEEYLTDLPEVRGP